MISELILYLLSELPEPLPTAITKTSLKKYLVGHPGWLFPEESYALPAIEMNMNNPKKAEEGFPDGVDETTCSRL